MKMRYIGLFIVLMVSITAILSVVSAETPFCPADIYQDGVVNNIDLKVVQTYWGQQHEPADLNHDGVIGINDFLIVLAHWGACPG